MYDVKYLFFGLIFIALPALSAGLRSPDASQIEGFIEQKLEEANKAMVKDPAKERIQLQFQYGEVGKIAHKLAGSFNAKTNAAMIEMNTVELHVYLAGPDNKKIVGYIELNFEVGRPVFFHNDISIKEKYLENAYYVFIKYLTIYPDFVGKGYSSQALMLLHDFLDRLGIDYVALYISSATPHTGALYVKAGYEFIASTVAAIKEWAAEHGIAQEEAVQAFLKDTSRKLKQGVPYMIRHGQSQKK